MTESGVFILSRTYSLAVFPGHQGWTVERSKRREGLETGLIRGSSKVWGETALFPVGRRPGEVTGFSADRLLGGLAPRIQREHGDPVGPGGRWLGAPRQTTVSLELW